MLLPLGMRPKKVKVNSGPRKKKRKKKKPGKLRPLEEIPPCAPSQQHGTKTETGHYPCSLRRKLHKTWKKRAASKAGTRILKEGGLGRRRKKKKKKKGSSFLLLHPKISFLPLFANTNLFFTSWTLNLSTSSWYTARRAT